MIAKASEAAQARQWSDFEAQWSKLHLHDIAGYPEWMPQVQEMMWFRFEQLYYLFYTYATRGTADSGVHQGMRLCMGMSEFFNFVKECRLTTEWLSGAKVDSLVAIDD